MGHPRAKLLAKQERFAREFVIDLNATRAAARAGYKKPEVQGSRLLKHKGVAALIAELQSKKLERAKKSADEVLAELERLAFLDVGTAFTTTGRLKALNEIPEDTRRALVGLEVEEHLGEVRGTDDGLEGRVVLVGRVAKVRFADKLGALGLLAKHHGLVKERIEHDATESFAALVRKSFEGETAPQEKAS